MDFGKFGNCIEGRIYAIRKDKKLNQEQFGQAIGVTRSAVCNYENGSRPIGEQVIRAICHEFHVSDLWLRTGEGEPYESGDGDIMLQFLSEFDCTKFEGEFLKGYFQMSKQERFEFVRAVYRLVAPFMKALDGKNPFADYFDSTYGVDLDSQGDLTPDQLHAELDRQLAEEKEAAAGSKAYSSTG